MSPTYKELYRRMKNVVWVELAFQEDQPPSTLKPVRINSEFDNQNLVCTDIEAEEVGVAESRIFDVDSERHDVEENTQFEDSDSMDGFTTSASEGENCTIIILVICSS
ncbi:Hypothetical predicted protein [Olea europaea subsp. europaea]|uniref:Uncharacterized protein n=1 Tax=Olea europaea subsp. europaea TaxID=158383 RepID=A0A8S0QDE6_OLEEU|nr:Hypothetical predicted protein [Olea europaea subsp. europaea]